MRTRIFITIILGACIFFTACDKDEEDITPELAKPGVENIEIVRGTMLKVSSARICILKWM